MEPNDIKCFSEEISRYKNNFSKRDFRDLVRESAKTYHPSQAEDSQSQQEVPAGRRGRRMCDSRDSQDFDVTPVTTDVKYERNTLWDGSRWKLMI